MKKKEQFQDKAWSDALLSRDSRAFVNWFELN